ncbi:hypothetical protein [Archangium sp.]|jgi:hypothetical protein|uniref:hypothetical protein n=1 Tax=Archangium sp. TaxID=1872627 RepID=UPI002ED7D76D
MEWPLVQLGVGFSAAWEQVAAFLAAALALAASVWALLPPAAVLARTLATSVVSTAAKPLTQQGMKRVLGDPSVRALKGIYKRAFPALVKPLEAGRGWRERRALRAVLKDFSSEQEVAERFLRLALDGAGAATALVGLREELTRRLEGRVPPVGVETGLRDFVEALALALKREVREAQSPLHNLVTEEHLRHLRALGHRTLEALQEVPSATVSVLEERQEQAADVRHRRWRSIPPCPAPYAVPPPSGCSRAGIPPRRSPACHASCGTRCCPSRTGCAP